MARAEPSPTPNPNAMKFTLDVVLPHTIAPEPGATPEADPLTRALLAADGVASIYGVNNSITVSRRPGADWDRIVAAVQDAVSRYLPGPKPAIEPDRVEAARRLLRQATSNPPPVNVEIRNREDPPIAGD